MTVQTREELETLIDQVTTELIGLYDIAEKKATNDWPSPCCIEGS